MADSELWRGLAEQFRTLPASCRMLRADRYYVVGSGEIGQWMLVGTTSAMVRFEALARRAASEIPDPPTSDLLTAWLEVLMKHGDSGFRFNPIATEENPDGSQGRQYMTGSMHELPSVSANYCQTLESAAVQAEFEEKRRNDPRNWSQLRQQYEAFRSMKDVINEPAERIPEEWVRSTIARIQGIKPEDVTLKQIAFEVAGLLSSTKRHIEMIPSAPQGSPPALEPEPSEGNAVQSEPKPTPVPAPVETVAAQLQRLRKECNWSAERLAEAVKFDPRTVTRHLSGETTPHLRNIAAYERVFSKQLKRQVVINKMP